MDNSGNRLAKCIRTAEQEKIPVVAVVGEKEKEDGSLAVRLRKQGDIGSLSSGEVLAALKLAIDQGKELSEMPGYESKPKEEKEEKEANVE